MSLSLNRGLTLDIKKVLVRRNNVLKRFIRSTFTFLCIFPSVNGFGTEGNSQGTLGSNEASWPPVVHCCHSFRLASNSPGLCDFISAPTGPKRCLSGQGKAGRGGGNGGGFKGSVCLRKRWGLDMMVLNLGSKIWNSWMMFRHLWVRKCTWGLSFLDFQKEFKKKLITIGNLGL